MTVPSQPTAAAATAPSRCLKSDANSQAPEAKAAKPPRRGARRLTYTRRRLSSRRGFSDCARTLLPDGLIGMLHGLAWIRRCSTSSIKFSITDTLRENWDPGGTRARTIFLKNKYPKFSYM
eukprot:SAG31_NODE_4232_length_3436_cov_1.384477_1_plen_121_part_00